MPRPKKTETQIAETRAKILDTAYAILQEAGPQAVTSRAIAERMGIAHMSLFHTCFENQAGIFVALRDRELTRLRAQQQTFAELAEAGDILQAVKLTLEYPIRYGRENPHLYYLAWVMPEAVGEGPEQNRHRVQGTVEHLARLLKMGMDRGVFTVRDPALAAGTVLAMINAPYILFHSGRLLDADFRDRMVQETLSAALLYLRGE